MFISLRMFAPAWPRVPAGGASRTALQSPLQVSARSQARSQNLSPASDAQSVQQAPVEGPKGVSGRRGLGATPRPEGEPINGELPRGLYRKHGPTHRALVAQMVQRLAALFPDRTFHLIADGAYAPLAGWGLPRTEVTSRMRQDAALYALPPPRRTGQVGRPRKKGRRLLCPKTWAHRTKKGWKRTWVDRRGRLVQRLLLTRDALGYHLTRTDLDVSRERIRYTVRGPEPSA
jgi:hypothetical protein